ncbi:hypothetical protein KP77_19630 [Jeotgalibacillus alimentarius]|uniref:HTH marR-type domain-containing protein n=1 Tax=Jeotgalibacillus alimentarius TaxID=135826 RepID=A0A0C2VIP1_9BACL|nr:MarR family transcriptional regulator [Jeotgalibacillus alimentarius]KIL48752.1 hypothetical protein KP77_19630 [Jeotgalibacillus alimentarius]
MTTTHFDIKRLHATIDEMSDLLSRELDTLEQFNLTDQQENYLMYCVTNAPLTAKELVEEFQVSKSAISQVVAKLEKERFIEREKNPENLRETLIYLGPKGRMFARRLEEFNSKIQNEYYVHLTSDEIKQMISSIEKLNKVIKENQSGS